MLRLPSKLSRIRSTATALAPSTMRIPFCKAFSLVSNEAGTAKMATYLPETDFFLLLSVDAPQITLTFRAWVSATFSNFSLYLHRNLRRLCGLLVSLIIVGFWCLQNQVGTPFFVSFFLLGISLSASKWELDKSMCLGFVPVLTYSPGSSFLPSPLLHLPLPVSIEQRNSDNSKWISVSSSNSECTGNL